MSAAYVPYSQTGYFSKTICDYLGQEQAVRPFYHRFPSLEALSDQIQEKQGTAVCEAKWRETLSQSLMAAYGGVSMSEATANNIESLKAPNTFTITTGHQLNLFTGPLYFLYKIVSVINFCKQAKQTYPDHNFVPVYWMATEDHDFDEINYFNFKGSKVAWNRQDGGAVGELSTEGLQEVSQVIGAAMGKSIQASYLRELFENAYLKHDDLASATRYLANALFTDQGLVIVDGNDPALKAAFAPYAKQELLAQKGHEVISATTADLVAAGYKEQVHPREINLFYLDQGLRERIVQAGDQFVINDTDLTFSKAEILEKLEAHPEQFSPNALLRPLYQEVILPNLCYIGGGGELAYWLQLKDYFDAVEVTFPMLMLRNSALLITEKQMGKWERLDLSVADLFKKQEALAAHLVKQHSGLPLDFEPQKKHLKKQFEALYELAKQTDPSFEGAVAAQEKKQINGLKNLEKRLRKAEKRNHKDRIQRAQELRDAVFPANNLQERKANFSEFYLEAGDELIPLLLEQLDPFKSEFSVIRL
ncbi:bacillithiol biosynthesis cysteine-adding enzyme BshC [Gilvibacter sediminis]|uniref:bacillithiol biosynthesis cysteine-adding enzyme BshC n=1 Tax=Gilvibacter sediminis TaxID=379071 RepID=UPI00234FE9D1|nr:bacillithiol biosynthesis cysteine-adding enzyme BshC [Gilvibacter sediminis]MDC7998824.1 bacillithiol biosynthesis cysteine-adding enzyme BshC [Gilvibacter sediminis]